MILIIGHKGEVGSALYRLAKQSSIDVIGADVSETEDAYGRKIDFMHVCIPYSEKFLEIVANYAQKYSVDTIIVHSTVAVGTCERLKNVLEYRKLNIGVYHSPVRGTHPHLEKGLLNYVKFYAPFSPSVQNHLESFGMQCYACGATKDTEYMKLMNTTYYGKLIEWTTEMKKMADKFDVPWKECEDFIRTTNDHTPRPLLRPSKNGKIGGHCVIPNARILYMQTGSLQVKSLLDMEEKKND